MTVEGAPPSADENDEQDGIGPVSTLLAGLAGVVMVVGQADTGKTTLVGRVARRALERGIIVAVVDSDVGQSNIGPPACVGMSLFREAPEQFRVRRADGLAFVGATSPSGFFLDLVSGVCSLAAEAQAAGAGLVLVDTSGIPLSAGGFRLKEEKLLRLRPNHLVLLEKNRELYPLAQLARSFQYCSVHRVPVSLRAHLKPAGIRRVHRKTRFSDYFHGSRPQRLDLSRLGIRGASLLSGRPLSPHARVRVAELLHVPVLRSVIAANRLSIVTARPASAAAIDRLQQRFFRLRVSVYTPGVLDGLLFAMGDGEGKTLDLGIVQACDFSTLSLTMISPLTDLDRVRNFHLGALRLRQDGTELGALRPGEY